MTSPGRYELTVLGPDGSIHLIIRDLTPRRAVDEAVRASVTGTRSPEDEELPFPDSLPAWDRIVIGAGQIWLRHFVLPTDSVKHWSVYTKRGASKMAVAFPSMFDLTAVLGGRAYGTTTSALGIERVQVFDLVLDR